jgi:transcription elongation factor Elf1
MNGERYPSGYTNCPICGGRAHWCVDDFSTTLFCAACEMRKHMEWLDIAGKINAEYDSAVRFASEKRKQAIRLMNQERDLMTNSVDFHYSEFRPYTPQIREDTHG